MRKSTGRHLATSPKTMITSLVLAVLLAAGATSAALLLNVHTSQASDCTSQPPYVGVALKHPNATAVSQFSAATGVAPNTVEVYRKFGSRFPRPLVQTFTQRHALTLIQINPRKPVKLAQIVAGKYDRELQAYAIAVRKFHCPVAISFGHEMNGNWYPWSFGCVSPRMFKAAWRHIHDEFTAEHATNVIWVWTINRKVAMSGNRKITESGNCNNAKFHAVASPARWWWPGGKYVNWIGIDGYYSQHKATFDNLFDAQLAQVRFTHKPVLITETAIPNNWRAASKIRKIRGLFKGVNAPGMLGFVWFDIDKKHPWRINTDQVAPEAFHSGASEYGF